MTKYEHELRAFDGAGLDDVETDAALTYLLGFVQASARAAADARRAAERSEQTDVQWWDAYDFGLQRVLDGLGVLIAERTRR